MIHGKYHSNTGYLLGNVDAGHGQMTRTDESLMMMSCWGRTSQSHKRIAQNKMTSRPRMEMTNDAFRCSRATQVHMEYLRLVNLTEICPSQRGECFKAPC